MISIEEALLIVLLTILAAYAYFKATNSIKKKLKEAKALSPETSVKPEEAGISWESFWLELVAERTKDGRYFLPTGIRITSALILVAAATITAVIGVIFDVSPFFMVLSWVVAIILISAVVKSLKRTNTVRDKEPKRL